MNRKIKHIHEMALRLVHDDYVSSFDELLRKDKSVCILHRNVQRVATEMFKVKYYFCLEIVRSLFLRRKGDKFGGIVCKTSNKFCSKRGAII